MLKHISRQRQQESQRPEKATAHEAEKGVCRCMIAARMALDAFRHQNVAAGLEDWSRFKMAVELLDHAIDELRRSVHGLPPEQLAAGGFPAAIAFLLEEIQAAGGLDAEFRQDALLGRIAPRQHQAAVRIVQEALANACRHSPSKRLFLELTLDRDVLRIQVRDWGVNFDLYNTLPRHSGRNGNRQPVKLLGGTATLNSQPGQGTSVSVELPLTWRGIMLNVPDRHRSQSPYRCDPPGTFAS